MSDYYGYAPLLRLERPLLLCGVPGAEVGTTARVITMLTGLPLTRLAHRVAHVVGESHDRALLTLGEAAVLAHERRQLEIVLGGRTPPVVALSPITLTDPRLRRLAIETTDLLHLRIDLRVALARIRTDTTSNPGKHLAVRSGGPADDDAVLARLRFLDRLCRDAPDHIDIGDRLPLDVGREVAMQLEAKAAS